MNLALWIVQGMLCAVFLVVGGMKVFAYETLKRHTAGKTPNQGPTLSKGLTTFIGISELAGAAGIIVPMATGIARFLTPLAALGLAVIMLLASIYHLGRKESALTTIVLLLLTSFVVYGRAFS
jgi:DoxX-like family